MLNRYIRGNGLEMANIVSYLSRQFFIATLRQILILIRSVDKSLMEFTNIHAGFHVIKSLLIGFWKFFVTKPCASCVGIIG